MTIKEQIDQDLTAALKSGDEKKRSVLRLIKSAVKNGEIETRHDFNDEEILKVLSREAKKVQDSIEQFGKGGRADLVEKEKEDLAIIESYLPQQMTEEEIRLFVKKKVTADSSGNFGKLMGETMKELGTRADGNLVRKILEEELK